ncbi:MAG: hypothetical protein J6C26_02445 [Clostridia bacterium]|nr:hypothetical protein [Clostridia bacterium]
MFVEIEFYGGDCILCGKHVSVSDFQEQIRAVEALYDRDSDNFTALLCRMFGWEKVDNVPETAHIAYTYDRDTERILTHTY